VRQAPKVTLLPAEREELERWVRSLPPSDRLTVRARVILEASGGRTNGEIARVLGIHTETVTRWRRRFVVNRLEGLRRDAPRSGARTRTPSELVERIVRVTLEDPPPDRERWTTRSLAKSLQVNHMLIHRIWRARGLSPSSPTSTSAPKGGQPWVDVVGVYLDAPAAAVVFAVGVRNSAAEGLPAHARADPAISGGFLLPGTPTSITGLLTRGEELLSRVPNLRQSPSELLVFLRSLEESTPEGARLEVVFDRPLEFVSERVSGWLNAHPRFRAHAPAVGGSWVATVDGWLNAYRGLTLHPDSFRGATELISLTANGAPQPIRGRFSWTSPPGLRTPEGSSGVP
jgi:transposase